LPEAVRAGIVAMVKATSGQEGQAMIESCLPAVKRHEQRFVSDSQVSRYASLGSVVLPQLKVRSRFEEMTWTKVLRDRNLVLG